MALLIQGTNSCGQIQSLCRNFSFWSQDNLYSKMPNAWPVEQPNSRYAKANFGVVYWGGIRTEYVQARYKGFNDMAIAGNFACDFQSLCLSIGLVRQVDPPPPFQLISFPWYSVTRHPASSRAALVAELPATIRQLRGPSASTLHPMELNSFSSTSMNL